MIEYKIGNLLDVEEGFIAHGVNCQGVMGSGVALAVRKKYPEVFKEYVKFVDQRKNYQSIFDGAIQETPLLGETLCCKVSDKLTIANMFTQDETAKFPGDKVISYIALAKCFNDFYNFAEEGSVLNIPKIGAGLAGGDWGKIQEIINLISKDNRVICWTLE